jgi:hypothetical protein
MSSQGQGQRQQQLQQKRITKKTLLSKSANAAGPPAIPFNLAASRLPPMSCTPSQASPGANDGGFASEYSPQNGTANGSGNGSSSGDGIGMSMSGSSSSVRFGLGQSRGIAQGGGGMNPITPLGSHGAGKIINLSGTTGMGGLGSIGMPVDFTSRGIHSAPSVSRSENFALPPIQATMTPTNKTKVAKPKSYLSNSSEGSQNYR